MNEMSWPIRGRSPTFVAVTAFLLIACISALAQHDDIIIATHSSVLDDINSFNASCPPKDSCRLDKASRISDIPDFERRNCLCDELCSLYGDCCPDSKRFSADQQPLASTRFSCLMFKQYNLNWVVNKCPADWKDPEVALACELEPTESEIHLDPIGHMPVTSTVSGVTYRNMNCAICHREGATSSGHDVNHRSSPLRFWNPRLECSTILPGNLFMNKTTKEDLASKIRWDSDQNMWGLTIDINGQGERFHSCFVDPSLPDDLQPFLRPCQLSTDDCPSTWEKDDVREKCRSYTSFVYRPFEVYRNVHCAICNGIQPWDLTCNSSAASFRQLSSLQRDFNPNAFALLFDLKDSDGSGVVGQQKRCYDGQLYDPFSRKCRQVFCSQPGAVYRDGRCLNLDSSTSPTTSSTESPSSPTPVDTTTDHDSIKFPDDPDVGTSTLPSTTTSKPISSRRPSTQTTEKTTTSKPINETNESGEMDFLSCPKFSLSRDEVEWRENNTLFVISYNKTFAEGQFQEEKDGSILICAHGTTTVSKFDPILGWVTVAGLGLSELCLGLHLLAFMISPDLRNLSGRNLASLSLALFAAYGSFIAAQFVPVGGNVCIGVALSTYYFFLSAFWWTSVLAWDVWRTIRLATVQLRCSSSGQQWGKFTLYSLYAWLVPGLIVTSTVLIEYLDVGSSPWVPNEYRPNFGQSVCWFGQRKAILVYFALPLAAVLFVNLLLFINSTYMIRSTTAKSPTSSNQNGGTRKQLGLYIRLALIMGLSWIAGLIAGAADFMPLWYVFVALCSLQGVFILLAYTCNPKVARSIRHRILYCRSTGQRRQSTYRTALVSGLKGPEHLRRLGLEARDSHDSQVSNTSQTSQTSLTKTSSNSSTSP